MHSLSLFITFIITILNTTLDAKSAKEVRACHFKIIYINRDIFGKSSLFQALTTENRIYDKL